MFFYDLVRSNVSQWDDAYDEVKSVMSKIDAIRDLEIKLRDMEAELGGVLDDLEEIRCFALILHMPRI